MSVYKNEKVKYLDRAIDSILKQTVLPNEILIVKDGPLTNELDKYLKGICKKYDIIKLLPLEKNQGLGLALRAGLNACSNELIARMDTDDIAKPDRFEKQLIYLKEHPEIALLGSCIEEFSIDENKPDSKTILPLNNEDIINFAKKRNPFRHMTVFFKKSAVIESGNYRHFLWFEDYDLWVRMMCKGFKTANLKDRLVSVRADKNMFARRGGWKYLKQDIKFQRFLLSIEFVNISQFIMNVTIRFIIRLMPNEIRSNFYRIFLRK